jgi:hypothetical protein
MHYQPLYCDFHLLQDKTSLFRRPVLTQAVFFERLAAALADLCQSDDARILRSPAVASFAGMSRVCGDVVSLMRLVAF